MLFRSAIHQSFAVGLVHGLAVVVFISISLAIFNLLPLPILDGGHITLALIEAVTRKRLPVRVIRPVFYVFFVVIICFALYVTVFDIGQHLPDLGRGADDPLPRRVDTPTEGGEAESADKADEADDGDAGDEANDADDADHVDTPPAVP